jgi:hypothetical protein
MPLERLSQGVTLHPMEGVDLFLVSVVLVY